MGKITGIDLGTTNSCVAISIESAISALEDAMKGEDSEGGRTTNSCVAISIESAISALEEAMKGEDKDQIESKTKELADASAKMAERLYANQQEGAADACGTSDTSGSAGGGDKDDVFDAEFEEVKSDNRSNGF